MGWHARWGHQMLQPFSAKQTPTTIMWVLVGDAQLHTHSNSDVADYFHLSRFGTTVVETIRWHRASSLHRHPGNPSRPTWPVETEKLKTGPYASNDKPARRLQHFKILAVALLATCPYTTFKILYTSSKLDHIPCLVVQLVDLLWNQPHILMVPAYWHKLIHLNMSSWSQLIRTSLYKLATHLDVAVKQPFSAVLHPAISEACWNF